MRQPPQSVRDLARLLHALEARESASCEESVRAALRAVEKLRLHLQKLVGVAGFHALMSRALALAKAERLCLDIVRVSAEGALEGFEEAVLQQDADRATKCGVALLTQLIGLLVTFIGEALTHRLLRNIWPELSLDGVELSAEEALR